MNKEKENPKCKLKWKILFFITSTLRFFAASHAWRGNWWKKSMEIRLLQFLRKVKVCLRKHFLYSTVETRWSFTDAETAIMEIIRPCNTSRRVFRSLWSLLCWKLQAVQKLKQCCYGNANRAIGTEVVYHSGSRKRSEINHSVWSIN